MRFSRLSNMQADADTSRSIRALVDRTYSALSTPGGDVAALFGHDDIAVAGSGQGELFYGSGEVITVAQMIASQGMRWVAEQVKVWKRGDVAWAQILGYIDLVRDGVVEHVPYSTTGVFGRGASGWQWLYWGGAEPQENPRV